MGSIDQNNSYVFPLNADDSFTGLYSSTTNFSEILISVETDTTFDLTINFSSNSLDIGLVKNYSVVAPSSSAFTYSIKPYLRYFQVVLTNTGINQTYLRIETILKSTIVYQEGGEAPASNVIITNPLADGYVAVSLQNVTSDYLTNGGLNNYIVNTSLAITNAALANMTFSDTDLLVSDPSSLSTLNQIETNTYTRGHIQLWNSPISEGGNTTFLDLSAKQVKLLNFYGESTANTTLTVIFSPNGIGIYKTQYSISVFAGQTFGFAIACSPFYVGIMSSEIVADILTIYIDYS